ncbi:MAG: CCA tRNA nucleotidyltransferase [Planctomycetota bacterium]
MNTTPNNPKRAAAVEIVGVLRERGFKAYLAGGCVRDELLGLAPKDYDVATDARPEIVRSFFRYTSAIGAAFGVILIHPERGSQADAIEVATFREDGEYSDRRRPDEVRFSTPEADAQRRDFTINALFLDPFESRVIDFVGGRADLEAKLIRAVGTPADRLAEDHLRALRAVRFASRLGFAIDRATLDAIREHASELSGVSRERIGEEVRKMLIHPNRSEAIAWMTKLGLDAPVLNEPSRDQRPTPTVDGLASRTAYPTALVAWAIDRFGRTPATDRATLAEVVKRWRAALLLTNDERDDLRTTLKTIASLAEGWGELGVAGRKRLASSRCFAGAFEVFGAVEAARAREIGSAVDALDADGVGLSPVPLLDGDDLISLGLEPGPVFAELLDQVYDAQLEGGISTKQDGIRLITELTKDRRVE